MIHYVAIVEYAGADKAIGIWFPDLPGCFSAGDDIDDALHNAHEALALYAEADCRKVALYPSRAPFGIEVRPRRHSRSARSHGGVGCAG